uniref:Uncharacterized protein n=3 Tax=Aegilops tauschii subsp. strangulata TaxID=200361 RepID=A0A453QEX5_AEGTS
MHRMDQPDRETCRFFLNTHSLRLLVLPLFFRDNLLLSICCCHYIFACSCTKNEGCICCYPCCAKICRRNNAPA